METERICEECGNDLVCEGYSMCSECMEYLEGDSANARSRR